MSMSSEVGTSDSEANSISNLVMDIDFDDNWVMSDEEDEEAPRKSKAQPKKKKKVHSPIRAVLFALSLKLRFHRRHRPANLPLRMEIPDRTHSSPLLSNAPRTRRRTNAPQRSAIRFSKISATWVLSCVDEVWASANHKSD
jgi:hypothetical protein